MRSIDPMDYHMFDYERILRVRQVAPANQPNVWEVIDQDANVVGRFNDEEFDKLRSGG